MKNKWVIIAFTIYMALFMLVALAAFPLMRLGYIESELQQKALGYLAIPLLAFGVYFFYYAVFMLLRELKKID